MCRGRLSTPCAVRCSIPAIVTVIVKLYGTLVQHVSDVVLSQQAEAPLADGPRAGAPLEMMVRDGCTVRSLLATLGLEEGTIMAVFVNGRARENDFVIGPGDQVGIFPPIGGG